MSQVLAALATYQCLHIDFFFQNQAFLVILSTSFGLLQSVLSQPEAKSTFFISSGEYKILIMKAQTITKERMNSEEEEKSRENSFKKVKKDIK